jgi:hypothetical protein
MRSNISRRLRQLEKEAQIHEAPQPIIFVKFVAPGRADRSSSAGCLDDGQVWKRRPGESEEAFEQRVFEILKRDEQLSTVVIFHPENTEDGYMSGITR